MRWGVLVVLVAACAGQPPVKGRKGVPGSGTGVGQRQTVEDRLATIQDAQGANERRLADLEARLAAIADQQAQLDDVRRAMQEMRDEMRALRGDLEAAIAANKPIGAAPASAVRRPSTPDPAKVYSVAIDGDPVRGKKTAKVTIVKGFEFACPYCVKSRETTDQLEKDYGDDVRIVYKHYVVHPTKATEPALAACAAQQQGKFWEMEQAIVEHAWDLSTSGSPRLKDPKYLEKREMLLLAKNLDLDETQFEKDMASQKCKDDVANDQAALTAVGTRGTPSFYINGRYLSGAQPIDVFKKLIDEELAKAESAIKAGTKAEKYYQKAVVDGGLKKLDP
jgi:protein-disulfide isomerase